jgi:hypothetical protein
MGYAHHSRSLDESMENIDSSKYYVILSKGTRLMMKSGAYANGHRGHLYIDEDGLKKEIGFSDLALIKGVSMGRSTIEKYNLRDIKSVNVDMEDLLRYITPEQAQSMCGYYIKSFNWVGTPYENEFNREWK